MSKIDEMLKLWFEETVIPHLQRVEHKINPTPEMFASSFRDYFSVRLRDVLPPHPISEKLESLRDSETRRIDDIKPISLSVDDEPSVFPVDPPIVIRENLSDGDEIEKELHDAFVELGEMRPSEMWDHIHPKKSAIVTALERRGYERCTPELLKKYPNLCLKEPMSVRRFSPDGSHWHRTVELVGEEKGNV